MLQLGDNLQHHPLWRCEMAKELFCVGIYDSDGELEDFVGGYLTMKEAASAVLDTQRSHPESDVRITHYDTPLN